MRLNMKFCWKECLWFKEWGKSSKDVLRLKIGCWLNEGRVRSKGWENARLLKSVRHLQSRFESFSLLHVLRSGNTHADFLATLATSSTQSIPRVILIEDLCKPTEVRGKVVHVHQVRVGPSWMDPIVQFLRDDILLEDKSEADKIRRKAPHFLLSED